MLMTQSTTALSKNEPQQDMAHEHTVMCEKLLVLQHMAPKDQTQSAGWCIGERFKLCLHVPNESLRSGIAYISV